MIQDFLLGFNDGKGIIFVTIVIWILHSNKLTQPLCSHMYVLKSVLHKKKAARDILRVPNKQFSPTRKNKPLKSFIALKTFHYTKAGLYKAMLDVGTYSCSTSFLLPKSTKWEVWLRNLQFILLQNGLLQILLEFLKYPLLPFPSQMLQS